MTIEKYCLVCGKFYAEKPYLYWSSQESDERYIEKKDNYDYPKCYFCGNDKHFIEYEYSYEEKHWCKDLEQFEKDLLTNPYYDSELIKERTVYFAKLEKECAPQIREMERQVVAKVRESLPTPNIPKCPTCGSTDIKDISTLNRMVSVGAFGLASDKIGKTKECKNCGYKW